MSRRAEFEAYIGAGDCVFDARDAALLRAIDEYGSLNRATEALGRSFSHAQRRVVELEDAFGALVERRRGGTGGGGSELTAAARDLLARFDRLNVELGGVADVERTVLRGTVIGRDGELATVETDAGDLRALVPPETCEVEVFVRADAVTLHDPGETPEPAGTSARNRLRGRVVAVEPEQAIATVRVDVGGGAVLAALVTRASVDTLGLAPDADVVVSFKATATRVLPGD